MRQMSDSMLIQCLHEADRRKSDSGLPLDVRVRSFQTYAMCLREATNRGLRPYGLTPADAGHPDNVIL